MRQRFRDLLAFAGGSEYPLDRERKRVVRVRPGRDLVARRRERAIDSARADIAHQDAHRRHQAVVDKFLGEAGVRVVVEKTPSKPGTDQTAAPLHEIENDGNLVLLETGADQDVEALQTVGGLDPRHVGDPEFLECIDHAAAAQNGDLRFGLPSRNPLNRLLQKCSRVALEGTAVEIGRMRQVHRAPLAVERAGGGEGARAIVVAALRERERIVAHQDQRPGQRPAADVDGLDALQDLRPRHIPRLGCGGFSRQSGTHGDNGYVDVFSHWIMFSLDVSSYDLSARVTAW